MSVFEARSRVANEVKKLKRAGGDESAAMVQDARRALAEATVKAYVERVMAQAPPLSPEIRACLEALLRSTSRPS